MVVKRAQFPKEQKTPWAWYLLPILFGLIGGIIGYFLLKNKDLKTAKNLIWVSVIMWIVVIGAFAYFGVLNPSRFAPAQENSLGEEYQRYVDAINNDATSLEKSLNKWNILMEQINKGGTVDISDLESARRDYADEANIIKPKIQSLKAFITTNEAKLKEAGLDTFQEKQDLDEILSGIENNVRNMGAEIEKLSAIE